MRRHDVHITTDGTIAHTKVWLDGVQVGGLQRFELSASIGADGEVKPKLVLEIEPARVQVSGTLDDVETKEIERIELPEGEKLSEAIVNDHG